MTTVSVILPTFNRCTFLAAAVESVLQQSYDDFELIVVDDGSTDPTPGVLSTYQSPRLHVIHQENGGVSAARNTGIRASRGNLIAFLDSDDWFLPGKLTAQVHAMQEHPQAALCYHSAVLADADGNERSRVVAEKSGRIYRDTVLRGPIDSFIVTSTVMLRKSALERAGEFDENLHGAEDLDLWRRILRNSDALALPGCLAVKRVHPGGYYTSPAQIDATLEGYLRRALQDDRTLQRPLNNPEIADLYIHYAVFISRQDRWGNQERRAWSRRLLQKALMAAPFYVEVYAAWRRLLPDSLPGRLVSLLRRARV